MRRIADLTALAWQTAIEEVATKVNSTLGLNLTVKNDWEKLESLATEFDLRFDNDGNLIIF